MGWASVARLENPRVDVKRHLTLGLFGNFTVDSKRGSTSKTAFLVQERGLAAAGRCSEWVCLVGRHLQSLVSLRPFPPRRNLAADESSYLNNLARDRERGSFKRSALSYEPGFGYNRRDARVCGRRCAPKMRIRQLVWLSAMEKPMKKTKLPRTDSVQELAKFWDIHDLTDFQDELEEVREPVFVKDGRIRINLPSKEAKAVSRIAESRGISQEELVREWVLQKLARGRKGRPTRRLKPAQRVRGRARTRRA